MAAETLAVGDAVVIRGKGLGVVKKATAERCEVALKSDDSLFELGAEKAAQVIRPPMAAAEAASVLEILSRKAGEPDTRSWGEQYLELQRTLKSGTPLEQAALLQKLYRVANPSSAQERMLASYEEVLVGELAHVLKKKPGALTGQLHRGQPAFGYTAPDREEGPIVPLAASPDGWAECEAFRVFSGRMAIGEWPVAENDQRVSGEARANLLPSCRNGEWFAFVSEDQGEDSELRYALAHREAVAQLPELLGRVQPLGRVFCEGARVAFLDEEVREDKRYQRELDSGGRGLLGRGFIAELEGDGDMLISGAGAPEEPREHVVFLLAE